MRGGQPNLSTRETITTKLKKKEEREVEEEEEIKVDLGIGRVWTYWSGTWES